MEAVMAERAEVVLSDEERAVLERGSAPEKLAGVGAALSDCAGSG
jgi:hypothetical protein